MTGNTARWVPIAIALAIASASVGSPVASAGDSRHLTIYARATHAQFLSHADDRVRGDFANPFDSDTDVPSPQSGKGIGPGDDALFSFKLYSDLAMKKSIGSATYSCVFNFAHRAFCEADFAFARGTMTASGSANFNSLSFTLAVTSGTGNYLSARGEIASSPVALKNVHRLIFVLK